MSEPTRPVATPRAVGRPDRSRSSDPLMALHTCSNICLLRPVGGLSPCPPPSYHNTVLILDRPAPSCVVAGPLIPRAPVESSGRRRPLLADVSSNQPAR